MASMSIVQGNNGETVADRKQEAPPIQKQSEEEAAIFNEDATADNDHLVRMPIRLWR
jgi:hypothetical protein